MRRLSLASLAALALVASCASGGGGGVSGNGERDGGVPDVAVRPNRSAPGVSFSREDRVLLSDATEIEAVAVSRRLAFAATPGALIIYDRLYDAWQPPVPMPPSLAGSDVTVMAADPMEDAVWMGAFGTVVYYRPLVNIEWTAIVPGRVDRIMFDSSNPASGAYVLTGTGWNLVSRSGIVTPVGRYDLPRTSELVGPPSLREISMRYPVLSAFGPVMTRGEDLQTYQISAAAVAPDDEQLWVGTRGNGLFHVAATLGNATHLPFGLLAPGAGALALAADGIWIAGLGRDPLGRDGLTFARADLQRFRWVEGGALRPLRNARAQDLTVRGDIAWVATSRGLLRMDLRNGSDARRWSATNGLPDDIVLSVAATSGGVWAGTRRGLVFIPDSTSRLTPGRGDVGPTIAGGVVIHSLAAAGDTLWAGTDIGLIGVVPGDTAARRPAWIDSRLRQRIVGVARADSVVLIASEREVMLLAPDGTVTTPINSAAAAPLERITSIALDEKTIWAAGVGGVLVMARKTGVVRFLPAGNDIPGEALDVLLDPDFAWIGTSQGVLRLRRQSDGTVR